MKKLLKCALISFFLVVHLNAQEIMTNQSVIDMIELGFENEIIKSKINASDVNFDTDVQSLKHLKSKGGSSDIISLIIDKSNEKVKAETGIYYFVEEQMRKIEPNVFSGTKTNALAYSLSSGIANAKTKSYITGAKSINQVKGSDDIQFVFVFDKSNTGNSLGSSDFSNWWFKTATSPQEFVLSRMKQKKNSREVIVSKMGLASGGRQTGVDSKGIIPFKIEKQKEGYYKVTPNEKLIKGEYCFVYKGAIPVGDFTNGSVFDFRVE